MKNALTQPYPFYESPKIVLGRLFLLGSLIPFILIVFQPFGTSEFEHPYKNVFLAGYGAITFICFSIPFLLFPLLFPNHFEEEKWVVWKHILLFFIGLTLTAIGCFLYLNWFLENPFSFQNFKGFLSIFFAIGIFPSIILTLLDHNIKLKKYSNQADDLTEKLATKTKPSKVLTIFDEKGKASFQVDSNNLLFIQASSNYIEIYHKVDQELSRFLLRNSLSNIEKQLTETYLNRCHRSYIANLNLVEKITGNAQGYKLHFKNFPEIIVPVSRSKGKNLKQILEK